MILQEYLDNPMGSGDSSIANRQMIKAELSNKYNGLISEKKIQHYIYRDTNTSFLIHLVIPSESDRDNSYDVVFRFVPETKEIYNEKSIKNYDVQVFSNSPSFAYTFANAYESRGMFVTQLKSKFDSKIFKKDPVVRNRYKIVNYEKYVYFGARYLLEGKIFFSKEYLIGNARIYNPKKFSTTIRDMETIMIEYQVAEKKLRGDKRGKVNQNIGTIKQPKEVKTSKKMGVVGNIKQPKKPKGPKVPKGPTTIKKK